jgi:hypothetical protein
MKTREEAAKLLLENGWTLEEVNKVLRPKTVKASFFLAVITLASQPDIARNYAIIKAQVS